MKKFKSKKYKKIKLLKWLIYIILIFIFYKVTINILFDIKLTSSNEEFIVGLLNDSNHHMLYQKKNNDFINKFVKFVGNIDVNEPVSILKKVFGYEYREIIEEEEKEDIIQTDYISDPNPTTSTSPRVYIYNTHQLESYDLTNYEEYNITPNVLMASYLLKGMLYKNGIETMVETANIQDFLSLNGWNYNYSYMASKYYIEDTLKKYPNLDLLIDLHRDAIPKTSSTITIDDKNYAKVLFVVGTDHDNYQANLDLANQLNELIKKKNPLLSRGVITKGGENVNGIYNQDLSPKIVLIECGGKENSIDEVMNTISVLTEVITEYLGG